MVWDKSGNDITPALNYVLYGAMITALAAHRLSARKADVSGAGSNG